MRQVTWFHREGGGGVVVVLTGLRIIMGRETMNFYEECQEAFLLNFHFNVLVK